MPGIADDAPRYVDPVDGSEYPLDAPRWRSDGGRPLWIEPGGGISRDDIGSERSIWRYRAALPIDIAAPISMGEGLTPLIEREWTSETGASGRASDAPAPRRGRPLFKLDGANPTGSFKDRGTSVMLSYLRGRGVDEVLEDSSGNGGASVAGYAAAGGLSATIFAPATTSPAKIAQVRAYGAQVRLVDGPREESQSAAIRAAEQPAGAGTAFYASHNWQACFLQGTKSLAYELWEDLGFHAPDNVVVPVGAGSSLLGCWLGFRELLAAGQIDRLPRLFAAQPLNCSPVDASFLANTVEPVERDVTATVAEGTSIARPLRLAQMIRALRETAGGTVAVPEGGIVAALRELCATGLFVEPTSATAAAAYGSLLRDGRIAERETTVVLLSGSGLKAAPRVLELIGQGV